MIKSEVLHKLELDELIGTNFEDLMKVLTIKKGEMIYYNQIKELSAIYVLEGEIQYIVYSPEGGEFFIEHFPGDIVGMGATLSKLLENKMKQSFEVDLVGKEESVIVTLPFEKVFDMTFRNKEKIMKKLVLLFVEEHAQVTEYFFNKSFYSDEAFFIKFIEKHKTINKTTKELSELLNINHRTLQRIIKKLQEAKIIIKENNNISIGKQHKI